MDGPLLQVRAVGHFFMNGRHLRGAVLTQPCPACVDEDVPAEDRLALFGLGVAAVLVLLTLWFTGATSYEDPRLRVESRGG